MGASGDTIGILLALISTFLSGLGYVLQKKGHQRVKEAKPAESSPAAPLILPSSEDRYGAVSPIDTPSSNGGEESPQAVTPEYKQKPVWKDLYWLGGLCCMVAAAFVATTCFMYLDQSKQASMGSLTVVWNGVLAGFVLKEKVMVIDLISTAFIVTGAILAVVESEHTSRKFTIPGIVDLLNDDLVFGYTAVLLPLLLGSMIFIELTVRKAESTWTRWRFFIMSFLPPATGGMCNGFVAYFVKAVTTVFSGDQWGQLKEPSVYIYLVFAGLFVFCQIRYLNVGLAHFTALQVVPVFQSCIIFSNALSGIVYYHDMRSAAAWKLGLFGIGAALCILGISLLRLKAHAPRGDQPPVVETQIPNETESPRAGSPRADVGPPRSTGVAPLLGQSRTARVDPPTPATPWYEVELTSLPTILLHKPATYTRVRDGP